MYYQRCEPPIEAAYLRPRRGDLARGFFRRGLGAPGNLTTTSPDTGLVTPSPGAQVLKIVAKGIQDANHLRPRLGELL